MRLLERGAIDDRRRVEHDDVGIETLGEYPTVTDRQARRDGPRHLAHRVFQADAALLADVAAQDAWIRPARAWMYRRTGAIGIHAVRVRAELDPRSSALSGQRVLAHHESER